MSKPHKNRPYFKTLHSQASTSATWSVPALCAAYNWPAGLVGGGVIGIVELDGGWNPSDMDQFFASINQPLPTITNVSVNGVQNNPNKHIGDPADPDFEVALDIQVAAAAYFVATGKPANIRVYFADDIAPSVKQAQADGVDVFSISWGNNEAAWIHDSGPGQDSIQEMEDTAAAATAAGMVIFAAAGDNDSADSGRGRANVDVPAACPHVIGCGGTELSINNEIVWNESPGNPNGEGTGGGFSRKFPPQPFQAGAPHGPGRMVPDVTGNAARATGYQIVVHGADVAVGGTSAVAPLYAGLFASFGTKLGNVNPILWENHLCFNDITRGDNGRYRASLGPDPCSGLGSPIGTKLAQLFNAKSATAASLAVRPFRHTRM